MINEKKCKGYTEVLSALDNSTQEIMDEIIKPYQKNNQEESDDTGPEKIDYIENQMKVYLPYAMQEAKKIKDCFDTDIDSVKIAMLEARLETIKSFFDDLNNLTRDYDWGKRMSEFENKITNQKLFPNLGYNENNYPILFAVTDFADYYVRIKDLYDKLDDINSQDALNKITDELNKITKDYHYSKKIN